MDSENTREMSYGEKVVGLNFNPSGNSDVDKVKKLLAEVIDTVCSYPKDTDKVSAIQDALITGATYDLLRAQMMAVKAITWSK